MRILLADHHASSLWALRTSLQEEPGIELVGEAVNWESLQGLASSQHPNLILMDKGLPGKTIEDMIAALHRLKPRPAVIVMTSDSGDGSMLLRIGADAFASKGDRPDWLLQSIRKYIKSTPKKEEQNNNKF